MTAEIINLKKEVSNGFVAGTLVHTDKGLLPIEEIKIGDMVLSKSESGEGEQAYKRVISTFKSFENKKIYRISFIPLEIIISLDDHSSSANTMFLYCTYDHPFLVVGEGWQSAGQLTNGNSILLQNGQTAIVIEEAFPLLESEIKDVAIGCTRDGYMSDGSRDNIIDFRGRKPVLVGGGGVIYKDSYSDEKFWHSSEEKVELPADDDHPLVQEMMRAAYEIDENWYMADVYNIEIEDFLTYFVGHAGVWVHDVRLSKNNDLVETS
jgi:hypothetical protein